MLAWQIQSAAACLDDSHLYYELAGAFTTYESSPATPDMGKDSQQTQKSGQLSRWKYSVWGSRH